MGFYKQRQIELQERGFGEVSDKFVCANCITNKGIKDFIKINATEYFCSYCGIRVRELNAPISTSIEDVVGLIVRSIKQIYVESDSGEIPWDEEEQSYIGKIYTLSDVLDDLGFELSNNIQEKEDELYNDLTSSIECNDWVLKEYSMLYRSKVYKWGWERFVRQVKHSSRYFFNQIKYAYNPKYDLDVPDPSQMLEHLKGIITNNKMIKKIKKDTIIFRARICKRTVKNIATELGAPKVKYAIYPNRMSAAAIPMFYGALSRDVAEDEVMKIASNKINNDECLKISTFRLLKNIYIIDLSEAPDYCLFDENISVNKLNQKVFLNHFIRDFSSPIKKDGREHIEYVPTQIVSEYFKYKCYGPNKNRIKGVFYQSSQSKGISCVFFVRNNNCVDKEIKDDSYLQLINVETK